MEKGRAMANDPVGTPASSSTHNPASEPLAVDAQEAARLCGVRRAHWWRLVSSGRAPAPIYLGRRAVWALDGPTGLRAWMLAGCPPRDGAAAERWRARRAAELEAIEGGGDGR